MARPKKYIISLSESDVNKLQAIIRKKRISKSIILRRRILLTLNQNIPRYLTQIAERRYVTVWKRRKTAGRTEEIRYLLDECYPRHEFMQSICITGDRSTNAKILFLSCSIFPTKFFIYKLKKASWRSLPNCVQYKNLDASSLQSDRINQASKISVIPPKETPCFSMLYAAFSTEHPHIPFTFLPFLPKAQTTCESFVKFFHSCLFLPLPRLYITLYRAYKALGFSHREHQTGLPRNRHNPLSWRSAIILHNMILIIYLRKYFCFRYISILEVLPGSTRQLLIDADTG